MKTLIQALSIIAIATTVLQSTIAQANPSPRVKQSDAIFQQWEVVRDQFGCFRWSPIPDAGIDRYKMAIMIHYCKVRETELMTDNHARFSPDALKAFDPLVAEFAVETAILQDRLKDPTYDPSLLLRPALRPIAHWITPMKTLGKRYQCPSLGVQMYNPPDLRTARYDLASTVQICIDRMQKRNITMNPADAETFQAIQTEFADELTKMRSGGFCDSP